MSIKLDLLKVIALVEFLALCFTTYDNYSVRKSRSALESKVNYSNYTDKAWDVYSSFKDESQEIEKEIGSQTDSLLKKNIDLILLFHEINSLNQLWEARHLGLIEKGGDKIGKYEQVVDSGFKASKEIERAILSLVPPAARAEKACLQRILQLDMITSSQLAGVVPIYPPHGATIETNGSGKTEVIQTHKIEELLKNRSDSLNILVGEFALISAKTLDTLKNTWLKY